MNKLLDEKIAVVVGGSRGLGFAISLALAVDGARVVIASRNVEEAEAAAARVQSAGGLAEGIAVDVTTADAAGELTSGALECYGGIDILVNSAATFVWKKYLEVTPEEWRQILDTNLGAPFLISQSVARVMVEQQRGGAIINIASIHGTAPDANVVGQCATKAGLIGLTRAAAEALREHDIRVNAICPGAIEPDSPERRGESPQRKVTQADIATLVVFLASDLARSITGSVIDAHGNTRTVIKV